MSIVNALANKDIPSVTIVRHKIADDTWQFQEALKIENALTAKLKVIVNEIKNTQGFYHQDDYNRQTLIEDVVHNAVLRTYLIGAQYVNDYLLRDLKFTQHDLFIIKQMTADFVRRFNFRVDNYILARDENMPELSFDFIVSQYASYVVPQSLNVATKEKASQMLTSPGTYRPVVKTKTAALKAIEKEIPEGFQLVEQQPKIVLVWTTARDDRVCLQYCAPLEGMAWDVGDPDIPSPDQDTHPNCRCVLQLGEEYPGFGPIGEGPV